jgi:hypothetical protein
MTGTGDLPKVWWAGGRQHLPRFTDAGDTPFKSAETNPNGAELSATPRA